jgi:hypothetical protein
MAGCFLRFGFVERQWKFVPNPGQGIVCPLQLVHQVLVDHSGLRLQSVALPRFDLDAFCIKPIADERAKNQEQRPEQHPLNLVAASACFQGALSDHMGILSIVTPAELANARSRGEAGSGLALAPMSANASMQDLIPLPRDIFEAHRDEG